MSWANSAGTWRVNIKVNGWYVHLGYFVDTSAAALESSAAAMEHFGEFANLNLV